MLLLIGLGLNSKDISVRALEALGSADIIFAENYTSPISNAYIDYIEGSVKKKIVMLNRSDMEENLKNTISPAKERCIAILVPGDPLVATTHHILLDYSRKEGIDTKVFHAASIYSSGIGESGLDVYRFGQTTTIPFWSEKYKPTSFLDMIQRNIKSNAHTLVLLDIDMENNCTMGIREAVRLLSEAEKEKGYGIINDQAMILILSNIGREDQEILYVEIGKIDEKIETKLKGKMLSIIIPAKLNFAEQESVSKFKLQS